MKLSEIKKGDQALVTKVNGDVLALKLFEMGVLPGETVSLENIAPFGDPIAISIGESKLCLRLEDAAHVEIELREWKE
ncbi:MAG: ferrous iron transport protein A [Bacteroidia bacterium]|nr:ferrous iron transport protein A [Bacteroidia bacterium]